MSEQESVWFYTQHGERKGPVTLDVLRGAIEHMKIDREKDLIWGPGLSDWVTMDKVPVLQNMPAGPPSIAPALEAPATSKPSAPTVPVSGIGSAAKSVAAPTTVDPYKTPASLEEDSALADAMAERRETGGYGGSSRKGYILCILLLTIISGGVTAYFLDEAFEKIMVQGNDIEEFSKYLAPIGAMLSAFSIIGFFLVLARFKNLKMTRWWVLLLVVPFVNIWLGYRIWACPPGYGEHKNQDTAGKVLTIVYVLMLVANIGMSIYMKVLINSNQ